MAIFMETYRCGWRLYPALRRGRQRGAHTGKKLPLETTDPTHQRPGPNGCLAFATSMLLGDALVEVKQVMPQEQTAAKLSEV